MLKVTKTNLGLITDPDMYLFFENGTRGGISYISDRYSKANNKYLKPYDPKQESKHFICLDANNLYGKAMFTFFQTCGLKWINSAEKAIDNIEIRRKMLSEYQLKIADLCNIPINFVDKDKYVIHYENLRLKLKICIAYYTLMNHNG